MNTVELTVVEYTALFDFSNGKGEPSRNVKRRLIAAGALMYDKGQLKLTLSALESLTANAPRSSWRPPEEPRSGVIPTEDTIPKQFSGTRNYNGLIAAAILAITAPPMGVPPGPRR